MKNRIFTLISTLVISGGLCLFGLEYANALVVRGDCGQKSWAPNEGITRISNRAISNQFIWYGKPFTGTETTYEHETKTSDKKFANYGNYWISSLPNHYLDWGNSYSWETEDNFSIGTLSAEKIEANLWYYGGITLSPETSPSADFRIAGEKALHVKWCEIAPYCAGTIISWTRDRCVAVHLNAPSDSPVHWWK